MEHLLVLVKEQQSISKHGPIKQIISASEVL
jgi:hypothetical protein